MWYVMTMESPHVPEDLSKSNSGALKSFKMKTKIIILFLMLASWGLNAQWIRTNGPEGGFVTSLSKEGNIVYAAIRGGGIYKSEDNGASWTTPGLVLTNQYIFNYLCIKRISCRLPYCLLGNTGSFLTAVRKRKGIFMFQLQMVQRRSGLNPVLHCQIYTT